MSCAFCDLLESRNAEWWPGSRASAFLPPPGGELAHGYTLVVRPAAWMVASQSDRHGSTRIGRAASLGGFGVPRSGICDPGGPAGVVNHVPDAPAAGHLVLPQL
jgi:hypothetical protein